MPAAKVKIQQEFGGQLKAFNLVFSDEGFKKEYISFQEKIKKLPASQKISFAAGNKKYLKMNLKHSKKNLKDKIALIKVQIDNEQQDKQTDNIIQYIPLCPKSLKHVVSCRME